MVRVSTPPGRTRRWLRRPGCGVVLAGLCLVATVPGTARAVVLYNLPNSANQSDPATGVAWQSVAKVSGSTGGSQTGSAVYLGHGYLLTANHVTINGTSRFVTFDNATFYEIDPAFKAGSRQYGKQVAPAVDMAVIKLTTVPTGVTAARLLTSGSEQLAAATLIGWGVGRNPASPLAASNVAWGDASTAAKRWGLNTPLAITPLAYDGYSYETLVTVTGGTASPAGLGNAEAGLSTYDSGGGLFQQIGGVWYLIGVNAVTEAASTTFGLDRLTSPRGGANFFGRVSAYDAQIVALVPEPGGWLLAVAAAATWSGAALSRRLRSGGSWRTRRGRPPG